MRPIPDDDLILYLYGESPDATAIRARAQEDPAMAARIDGLRAVLDTVSDTHQEAAPSDLEDRLWQRLAPEIAAGPPAPQAKVVSLFRRVPRQALAIAATLILVVTAFALGRLSQTPTDQGPITLASDRILMAAVGEHLSRSQILLREVSNARRANELDRLQTRDATIQGPCWPTTASTDRPPTKLARRRWWPSSRRSSGCSSSWRIHPRKATTRMWKHCASGSMIKICCSRSVFSATPFLVRSKTHRHARPRPRARASNRRTHHEATTQRVPYDTAIPRPRSRRPRSPRPGLPRPEPGRTPGANWLTIISLLAALFAPALVVAQLPSWRDAADGQTGRDERYREGQRALDDGRYTEAAAAFATVAEEDSPDSDAARYWQAWAAFKAGSTGEARRALVRLRKDHPDSAWLDDAESLDAEIRANRRGGRDRGANAGSDDASPDALKLYALNSLMNSDSPQAVDAVVRLLDSTDDPKLRDRALFVLAQSDSAKAAEALAEIARGTRTPGLQRTAVRYLGMSETDANLALLQSIYETTNDGEVKEAVIEAYFLADDEERLRTLATRETNPDLTLKAIHKLGLIDATETLHGLYETANTETKSHILHALFLADDDDFLARVARTESDPELKQAAIHNLGLVGATDALHDLYAVSDNESKARILHALFLADDDDFPRPGRTNRIRSRLKTSRHT